MDKTDARLYAEHIEFDPMQPTSNTQIQYVDTARYKLDGQRVICLVILLVINILFLIVTRKTIRPIYNRNGRNGC
jgi:hypothetical protein